jgi:hypothetical protein
MKDFLLKLLLAVLILAFATGCVAVLFNTFGNGNHLAVAQQITNPRNIIDVKSYAFKSGANFSGITVTYDNDGVITLNGQATEDTTICLGMFYILEDNYYTMSVETKEQARLTAGTKICIPATSNYANETVLAKGNFATDYTFKSTGLQYVKVYMTFSEGDAFTDYVVAPVLVDGKEIGSFYVTEIVG